MNYWIRIITWEFWAWKTYNVFYEAMKNKYYNNALIISNIPYSFTDLFFSSSKDMINIFNLIVQYIDITNNEQCLRQYHNFKPVHIIIDEWHLYFYSRRFSKNFDSDQLVVNSQCRKRKIKIDFITQELAQLDSTFRRLVPYIRKYYRWLWFWRWYKDFYLKKDETDLKNEEIADVIWWGPIFGWFFHPNFKKYLIKLFWKNQEKIFFNDFWTSYYVTWFQGNNINVYNINDFINLLYTKDEIEKLWIKI